MSRRSYERQHLATYAAGSINAAGTTSTAFGCQLTRISQGVYGVLLGSSPDNRASSGLTDDENFTVVTVKGTTPAYKAVNDDSNTLKTVRVFDTNVFTLMDAAIEVMLYRPVNR